MQEQRKTVLLIEDDASFRESMRKVLEREGFQIMEAESAEAGIEILEHLPVDLILLDLYLGEMSGLEFLEKTKGMGRPPVIMITAYGDWDIYTAAVARGAVDCLPKPVKRNELLEVISTTLAKEKAGGC
jgi:DNA-binding NtrC family response regulator